MNNSTFKIKKKIYSRAQCRLPKDNLAYNCPRYCKPGALRLLVNMAEGMDDPDLLLLLNTLEHIMNYT